MWALTSELAAENPLSGEKISVKIVSERRIEIYRGDRKIQSVMYLTQARNVIRMHVNFLNAVERQKISDGEIDFNLFDHVEGKR